MFGDRLERLKTVFNEDQVSSLESFQSFSFGTLLLLADWGYSLSKEREMAGKSDRIQLVSLQNFIAGRS